MVFDGKRYNQWCCFDYGNAETSGKDDGNATMEAIYLGNSTQWTRGGGTGPWVAADLENGMFEGDSTNAASNTSSRFQLVLPHGHAQGPLGKRDGAEGRQRAVGHPRRRSGTENARPATAPRSWKAPSSSEPAATAATTPQGPSSKEPSPPAIRRTASTTQSRPTSSLRATGTEAPPPATVDDAECAVGTSLIHGYPCHEHVSGSTDGSRRSPFSEPRSPCPCRAGAGRRGRPVEPPPAETPPPPPPNAAASSRPAGRRW